MDSFRCDVGCFIHPKQVLRDEAVVHSGKSPSAAGAAGHRGCNRRASWPPSLSLGRSA